mgnify:CR=1 FL=1
MLDDVIIDQIIEREIGKEKKERRDSGWQPIPLYKELELPSEVERREEQSPGRTKIDIWSPQEDSGVIVIETGSYHPGTHYQ